MREYDENIMDFVEDFDKLIDEENRFNYYFLYHSLNSVLHGPVNYYDAWIYKNENTWISGLWIDGHYYFYGKNWGKSDVEKIVDHIDFSIFQNGFHFVGDYKLVNEIFNIKKLDTKDFKNRYFYQLKSKDNLKTDFKHHIEIPEESDIPELAEMYQQYFEEEYKGTNNKTLNEMKTSITKMIEEGNIYINKLETEISGFCTTMFTNSPEPLIGTLYVKEKFRNKNIAKSLLSVTTEKLLEKAKTCYLMTEMENEPSNKVVEKVGFRNINNHTDKIITGANTVYN
jgi:ribosomal protein S18 acetylase RimI-like enzyme